MPVAGGVFAAFMFFYAFSLLVIHKDLSQSDNSSFNPFLEACATLLEPKVFVCSIFGTWCSYWFGFWVYVWVSVL